MLSIQAASSYVGWKLVSMNIYKGAQNEKKWTGEEENHDGISLPDRETN